MTGSDAHKDKEWGEGSLQIHRQAQRWLRWGSLKWGWWEMWVSLNVFENMCFSKPEVPTDWAFRLTIQQVCIGEKVLYTAVQLGFVMGREWGGWMRGKRVGQMWRCSEGDGSYHCAIQKQTSTGDSGLHHFPTYTCLCKKCVQWIHSKLHTVGWVFFFVRCPLLNITSPL